MTMPSSTPAAALSNSRSLSARRRYLSASPLNPIPVIKNSANPLALSGRLNADGVARPKSKYSADAADSTTAKTPGPSPAIQATNQITGQNRRNGRLRPSVVFKAERSRVATATAINAIPYRCGHVCSQYADVPTLPFRSAKLIANLSLHWDFPGQGRADA